MSLFSRFTSSSSPNVPEHQLVAVAVDDVHGLAFPDLGQATELVDLVAVEILCRRDPC